MTAPTCSARTCHEPAATVVLTGIGGTYLCDRHDAGARALALVRSEGLGARIIVADVREVAA
jgi:hypothetical protein